MPRGTVSMDSEKHGLATSEDCTPLLSADLFDDPPAYYAAPTEPTEQTCKLLTGQILRVKLVGSSPLWGHRLFHSALVLARYLQEEGTELILNRRVLELGAGAGVPGLVCAHLSATSVVITDFPEPQLIENLRHNVKANVGRGHKSGHVGVCGYRWGDDTARIADVLKGTSELSEGAEAKFDLVILSDLLFNHSCHQALAVTIIKTLRASAEARALVFFTPHRPWLLESDLDFFRMIRDVKRRSLKTKPSGGELEEGIFILPCTNRPRSGMIGRSAPSDYGHEEEDATVQPGKPTASQIVEKVAGTGEVFIVEKLGDWEMDSVMFEDDKGDERLRATVFGFAIKWNVDWQYEIFGR